MGDFSSRVALVVAFLAIFRFTDWSNHSALAINLPKRLTEKKYHPKMESVLGMLREKYIEGRAVAENFSRKRQVPFHDDEVTVVLVPPENENSSFIDQAGLRSWGARVEAVSPHLLRASIPVPNLDKIADKVAGISYIRLPLTPFPAEVRSEGVGLINALAYHNSGYLGQNTKVAIIDLGFERLAAAQANGDIPYTIISKDFTGKGLSSGTTHGTDMAEIVHDVAPQAQLYLIKITDEVDLENAKDYCVSEGVDIINHSWGWFNTNFTDGTGLVCSIADDARSSGILWVNAAGNWAQKHYQGVFLDSDDEGWHGFSPGENTNTIQVSKKEDIYVYLTWNDWPTTRQDYDLYLFVSFGSDLVPIADSTNRQTGTQPPTESIILQNALPNTYYIAIYRYNATEDKELKIFSFSHSLQYQTPAYSLSTPADAAGVVAVAAIDQANWYTGPQEDYSSQGPTTDGRTKPDISGPTNVATFTSGRQGGTSGATPHVTGAASLLLSRYPGLTSDQIQAILERCAVDMGNTGKDNIYGSGRLNLSLNTPPILFWTGEPNYVSDGLEPDRGSTSTQFVYRVMYTDLDNDAPKNGYPKVHILKEGSEISDSPFTMDEVDTGDTAYTDGKLYTYTQTDLATGMDYSYYFEAKDQSNAKAGGAPTIERSGPDRVLSANLVSLIVYPNPFSPGKGHTQIVFDRLTSDATIRIFNLSGEEVFREDVSWQISWPWNVKNKQGEAVVRGIYIYLVTNSLGEKKLGKIAVIK
jgi:subtilisin family serine protease